MTRRVVFAFWAVVLIGLPFWWKTTEVYRANLPFSEIDAWQTKQACDFVMPTQFTIFIPSEAYTDALENDITQQLTNGLAHSKYRDNFPISIHVQSWNQGTRLIKRVVNHLEN